MNAQALLQALSGCVSPNEVLECLSANECSKLSRFEAPSGEAVLAALDRDAVQVRGQLAAQRRHVCAAAGVGAAAEKGIEAGQRQLQLAALGSGLVAWLAARKLMRAGNERLGCCGCPACCELNAKLLDKK